MMQWMGLGKPNPEQYGVEFWHGGERSGWLQKQGEYVKSWRRRWVCRVDLKSAEADFLPKPGVSKCLSIKGAEDTLNKPFAFEISTNSSSMFFIAESDKEKEDWINAVGRAIVKHSRSLLEHDRADYTN